MVKFFMEKMQKSRERRVIGKFLKLRKHEQRKVEIEICQNEYDKLAKKGIKNSFAVKELAASYHKSRSWVYERINLRA